MSQTKSDWAAEKVNCDRSSELLHKAEKELHRQRKRVNEKKNPRRTVNALVVINVGIIHFVLVGITTDRQ